MGLKPPSFAQADNPAADCDCILTRALTFLYLPVFNFWLLLHPKWLSFDWSMEAIPLIRSFFDVRNAATLVFYTTMFVILKKCYNYQCYVNSRQKLVLNVNRSKSSKQVTTILSSSHHNSNSFATESSLQADSGANPENQAGSNSLSTINCGYSNNSLVNDGIGFKQASINGKSSSSFFPVHLFAFTHHKHWSGLTTCLTSNNHRSDKANNSATLTPHHIQNKGLANGHFNYLLHKSGHKHLPQHADAQKFNAKLYSNGDVLMMAIMLLLVPFLLATNLLFYVGFVVAERVLYLPSMGFALMIALGVKILIDNKRVMKIRKLIYASVALVLLAFSLRTLIRNGDWISEENLYKSGIAINPPKGTVFVKKEESESSERRE